MVEIAKLQKENDKLNADFNSREIRIKWLQNKLKSESTAHQVYFLVLVFNNFYQQYICFVQSNVTIFIYDKCQTFCKRILLGAFAWIGYTPSLIPKF